MFRRLRPVAQVEALIVGLGNPGPEYAGTRHNVGFRVIEELAHRHRTRLNERRFRARWGLGQMAGRQICFAMPMTFMNLSGEAVASLSRHFGLKPDRILIILDDMAIPLGTVRVRAQGSAGGHNGLKSIQQRLGTQEYARVRVGINAAEPGEAIDHVLSAFTPNERRTIDQMITKAADACELWLTEGVEAAMNKFNRAE